MQLTIIVLAILIVAVESGQVTVGEWTVVSPDVGLEESTVREVVKPHVQIVEVTRQNEIETKEPIVKTMRRPPHVRNFRVTEVENSIGWKSWNGHEYKLFHNAKSFHDAEKKCRQHGGHLASIHSEKENEFIHRLARTGHDIKSFHEFVYIGLKMDKQSRKWNWSDGSRVDFLKWAVHQPDEPATEHCTQLHQDKGPLIYVQESRWNSISCNYHMKYFVCKK